MLKIPNTNFVSFFPSKRNKDKKDLTTADLNKETVSQVTQCTKVGDNGEVITVSITTEESHQAQVLGKYERPKHTTRHHDKKNAHSQTQKTHNDWNKSKALPCFFTNMQILGPDESHSVHKLKTTKIVVEQAAPSPEVGNVFTFAKSSIKSETKVEEVASFSLNSPSSESVISEHKELLINAVIEEFESDTEVGRKMSRGISIVSVSEDEKISIEKETVEIVDDEVEKLMQRIQKQRNVLDDILGQESSKTVEEKIVVKEEKVVQEVQPEGTLNSSFTNLLNFSITRMKINKLMADLSKPNLLHHSSKKLPFFSLQKLAKLLTPFTPPKPIC